MKLGFWTLGAPASLENIVRWCREYGFEGVDIRATRPVDGKPGKNGQVSIETSDKDVEGVRRTLSDEGIEIPILLCFHPDAVDGVYDLEWYSKDVAAHAQLAEALGASAIRLQVGHPGPDRSWAEYLQALFECSIAGIAGTSVGVAYENHPGSANAGDLLKGVNAFGDDRLGVIVSPDHCMTMQEDTLGLIGQFPDHIVEISYADRRIVQEDLARFDGRYYYVQYESCVPGEGDVPNRAIFSKLEEVGYEGYVSLKYEKSATFGHHLPPMDVAISAYSELMRQYGVPGKKVANAE